MKPEDLVLGTEYEILAQNRWERARLVGVNKQLQLRSPWDTTKISSSFEFDCSFSNGVRRTTIKDVDVAYVRAVPVMAPILPDDVGRLKQELAEAEQKVTALEKTIESQTQTIRHQVDTIETHSKTLNEIRDAMGCKFGQDARAVAKTLLSYKDEIQKRPTQSLHDYYVKASEELNDCILAIREIVGTPAGDMFHGSHLALQLKIGDLKARSERLHEIEKLISRTPPTEGR